MKLSHLADRVLSVVIPWVLAAVAVFVTVKVGIAAVGAFFVGLAAGSLGATLAGLVGLVVTYLLWQWTDNVLDDALHLGRVEE